MKKQYAYYSFAFGVSLLIHFSTMEGIFRYAPPLSPPAPLFPPQQHVNMQFMDAYKEKEQQNPPDPTPLIGTDNNRASQPELPEQPIEAKGQPYLKKTSDSKQIKTQSEKAAVEQAPQVTTTPAQPQTEKLDSTEYTKVQKEIKNIVREDIFEKKEVIVKKNEPEVTQKTTEEPEEHKEMIAKETPLTVTQAPSPEPIFPASAAKSSVQSPLDAKIDELLHRAQVDEKSVAELIGALKFNITKHNLGEYYAQLKRTISRNWQTRIMRNYSSEMFSSKSLIVFKINADGSIGFLKVLDSYGNPFFSKDCEAAILESEKFEPLPKTYIQSSGKKELWLFMSFGYNTD